MRIGLFPRFTNPPEKWDPVWFQQTLLDLESYLLEFVRINDGNLGFGDGTDPDNLIGKWLTYTTNAIADTEDTLTHDLGMVPVGFIVMEPPNGGFIYKGTTAWTTSQIFLKCSAANKTAKIFVVAPSHGISV